MILEYVSDFKYIFYNPTSIKLDKSKKIIILYFLFSIIALLIFKIVPFSLKHIFNLQDVFSKKVNIEINYIYFFNIVILAPILEEITFRSIQKKTKINLYRFLFGMSFFILALIYKINIIFKILFIILNILSFFILNKKDGLKKYNKKQSLLIIYSTSILFGFMHLLNYNIIDYKTFTIPFIYSFSKIFDAFILSILRLKFGLKFVIIFHSLINFIPFVTLMYIRN